MALVCGIVCSFNGADRLESTLPNIESFERRPDHLVLIDNGSDDSRTASIMEDFANRNDWAHVISTGTNLGPANGFATAMLWAVEQDFDFVWLLDDDSTPDPGCLSKQLESVAGDEPILVWPRQVTETGNVTTYQTWRGALIPTSVIRDVGVPGNEYIWGCEDTEYFDWRMKRLGYKTEWCSDATLTYTAANEARKRASWHYYYLTRNTVAYRLREQGNFLNTRWRLRRAFIPVIKLAGQIILKQDRKILKLRRLLQGLSDGLRGNLGMRFPPGKPDS